MNPPGNDLSACVTCVKSVLHVLYSRYRFYQIFHSSLHVPIINLPAEYYFTILYRYFYTGSIHVRIFHQQVIYIFQDSEV